MWKVYIAKCSDNTLYTGITTDLDRRLKEHNGEKVWAKYTKMRRPIKLVYCANFENRSEASKEEIRIKNLTRKQKQDLIQTRVLNINKEVLEYLKTIPKWKVTTYKALADKFWVHPRKIASIMRTNKEPLVYSCYKVISDSGKIWWYSAFDWVDSKIEMLEKDWVIIKNWKVEEFCILR